MHERPQPQCDLLGIAAHLVALAVERHLVDDIREAVVAGPKHVLGFLE